MVSKQLALLKSFIELFVIASFYFIVAAFKRIDYSLLTHNFGSHFFQCVPLVLFVSLRCLIYKVHAVFGGTFAIIQDSKPFVKNFFQVFSNFFVLIL